MAHDRGVLDRTTALSIEVTQNCFGRLTLAGREVPGVKRFALSGSAGQDLVLNLEVDPEGGAFVRADLAPGAIAVQPTLFPGDRVRFSAHALRELIEQANSHDSVILRIGGIWTDDEGVRCVALQEDLAHG